MISFSAQCPTCKHVARYSGNGCSVVSIMGTQRHCKGHGKPHSFTVTKETLMMNREIKI